MSDDAHHKFMTEKLHAFVDALKEKNADWVVDVAEGHGEVTVTVPGASIVDICIFACVK